MDSVTDVRGDRSHRFLVGLFITVGAIGAIVMVGSLIIALFVPSSSTGATGIQTITGEYKVPAPVATSQDASDGIPTIPPLVTKNYDYSFTQKTQLKDFKVSGPGSAKVSRGALVLKTTPGRTTTVSRTFTLAKASSISFEDRVSSEAGFDYGQVQVDGQLVRTLSGEETDAYSQHLAVGQHTISWSYTKDWDVADGSDSYSISDLKIPNVLGGGWV